MRDPVTQSRHIEKIQAVQFIQNAGNELIRHPDLEGVQLEPSGQAGVYGSFGGREMRHLVKGIIKGSVELILCADDISAATLREVIHHE